VKIHVENDNSIPDIDPNCMIVRVPQLEDIPEELHGRVSYPKSRNRNDKRQTDQYIRSGWQESWECPVQHLRPFQTFEEGKENPKHSLVIIKLLVLLLDS
jgi:hypothetical protein